MKECITCKKTKDDSLFQKDKQRKDGLCAYCKECRKSHSVKWRDNQSEHIAKAGKNHRDANKTKEKIRHDIYQKSHKKELAQKTRRWREKNSVACKEQRAAWYSANRIRINAARQKKRKENIQYRLKDSIRQRLYLAVRFTKKAGSAVKDLGCPVEHLKAHLEQQFLDGMTWDNWSVHGWHIDHKRPLSAFDLTDVEQFRQAVHYTNLQPLWAHDNISKSNKLVQE